MQWLYRLEEKKLTLERLLDMEPVEVSGILRQNRSGLLIQQYVAQFPYLDVQVWLCFFPPFPPSFCVFFLVFCS